MVGKILEGTLLGRKGAAKRAACGVLGLERGALGTASMQLSRLCRKHSEASKVIINNPSCFLEILFKTAGNPHNAFPLNSNIAQGSVALGKDESA